MIQTKLHRLFYGGIAKDRKVGLEFSHGYSRALDFRKKSGRMSVLPGGSDISNSVVVDLIQSIVQIDNGSRYALGNQGKFYHIDTNNTVSLVTTLTNSAGGLLYRKDTDELYATSLKTMSRYGKFTTGTLAMNANKYAQSRSTDSNAYRTGGSSSTTLGSSIAEGTEIEFTPDIEPLYSIKVTVSSKGTGDWTATLHDDADNALGTVTVTNANLPSSGQVEFVFSTPVRMLVKPNARTYHVHITSSNGTGSIVTGGAITSADYEIWADRFVSPNNGLHPIAQFLQYTVVGNERYLAVWEPLSDDPTNAEFNRHRLVFPPGYEVCGLAATDEFLVIATEMRSTDTGKSFQRGKIFFWDGLSQTYNQYIDVPEGSPQSLYTHNNIVYMIINGTLYAWPGGKELVPLRALPNVDSEYSNTTDNTVSYPNMMALRRNILLFGYPSYTTNEELEYGVYSWGRRDKDFSTSLGLNYSISTGTRFNTGGNLYMGGIWSFGDTLYVSWRDGSSYGLDMVDNSSTPATSASWESMEFEAGDPRNEKQALSMSVEFGTGIPDGYTVTPKWRSNWDTDWTTEAELTADNDYTMDLSDRFKMIEYAFDIEHDGTATEPLEITGISFTYDDLGNERPWGD